MRRSLALLLTALAVGAAFGPCGPGGPRRPNALSRAPQRRLRLCQEEPPKLDDKDWRAFRAKLVAAQQAGEGGDGGASTTPEGGFMYATPLIEQGSVILGGTDQEFGFALRQQYFHKCVILLLTHDEGFTKGIILNRPSALTLDGWRLWFGGDVAQGGLFRKHEPWKTSLEKESANAASSGLEMVGLHPHTKPKPNPNANPNPSPNPNPNEVMDYEAMAQDEDPTRFMFPSVYTTDWFQTMFVGGNCPAPSSLAPRIMDNILLNGNISIIFSLGLALLQKQKKQLLQLEQDGLVEQLKTICNQCGPSNELMDRAYRMNIREKHIGSADTAQAQDG